MSLYNDLRGGPAVDAAVNIFYDKVIADGRVSDFFNGVNIERQKGMQKKFLTLLLVDQKTTTGMAFERLMNGL
ncbi:MAG: hemoglobin [Candidatus Azotimanducaceae bacterium]|jgi:hemoglobin